jgi:hypothetical protein
MDLNKNLLHDLLDSSYKRNFEAEMIGNVHGLKLDHELSNSENKVFVDPDNNSHVVFTGSKKPDDLITNASLLLGLQDYHPRFIKSKNLINKVKSKYNNNINAYGDSLGGRLAEHVADKVDKVITNNKAVGKKDIFKKINSNQIDIRSGSDPVSFLGAYTQSGGQKKTIKNTNYLNLLKSHSYKNIKFL